MDYPYIRAWGRHLGSYNYYIQDQVALARETKAPQSAIYAARDKEGRIVRWMTIGDITNQVTRNAIQRLVAPYLDAA